MDWQISPAQLKDLLQSETPPRLLDVRQPEEFQVAALPGSVLVPLGELPARVSELEAWKDETVVVYCHHGIRSLHGMSALQAAGFKQVYNLSGGIDLWSVEVDSSMPRY